MIRNGISLIAISIATLMISCTSEIKEIESFDSLEFFDNERNPISPNFENLSVNDIKPEGWIKSMMKEDLEEGFVGELDNLVPILMKDDTFNSTRRKDSLDIPNVGSQEITGADWEISMQWWGAESQGNWWDGYLRNAYMTNNKSAIEKIDNTVKYLLSTQDADGYMGIYSKDMRYKHKGSNGELWAQTVIFRMLLGYYEFTDDKEVLQAVEKAMNVTMTEYNEGKRSPFDVKIDNGGVTHGLMMTDVCETLNRITGDKKYNDYAVYLYKEFSKHNINRSLNDVRYESLMEVDSLYQSHSAHTYEHLRTLVNVYFTTGYPELEKAYESAINKLSYTILPSGAGFGNEWLNKEKSKPDSTAAEFCGMLELRLFYSSALQKSGDIHYADETEKITFNAMLGARNEDGSGITYCKTDNCYQLNNTEPQSGFKHFNFRYNYSPTHADAAVCCNPSYSRSFPYYVSNMWMKTNDGFVALLYGPSTLTTKYNSSDIKIEQKTNYPFSDKIEFIVTTDSKEEISLYFRKPGWSENITIISDGAKITPNDDYFVVKKVWKKGDIINLNFENEIKVSYANNHEISLQRGAIVYALDIPFREETIKEWGIKGFRDYFVFPTNDLYKSVELIKSDKNESFGFRYVGDNKNIDDWYDNKIHLSGKLYDTKQKKEIDVNLVPMGITVLRRVTFKAQ